MEITDVRIRKIETEGKLKAVVAVTIDNAIVIHDIRIVTVEDKTFIAMPSRKNLNGEYKDIVHPINAVTREQLQKAILEYYNLM